MAPTSNKGGAPRREKKGAARLGRGLGEWKGHQKGALVSGKTTHILKMERGVRFRRGE